MSGTKFTPGPWSSREIYPYNAAHIAEVWDARGRLVGDAKGLCFNPPLDEVTANAHLIAAAPELYEALEELAAVPKPHPHPSFEGQYLLLGVELDQALDRARAALAKARGEA